MLDQQTTNELLAAFFIGIGNVFWMQMLLRELRSVPRRKKP